MHHLIYRVKTLSAVEVEAIQSTQVLSVKAGRKRSKVDDLEAGLSAYVNPPEKRRRRRKKGPQPDIDDDNSSSEEENEASTDSDDELEIHAEEEREVVAKATAAAKRHSFFWQPHQLGVVDVHVSPSPRAKCAICTQVINKGSLRGSYAFHVARPNTYIHVRCCAVIDSDMGKRTMQALHEVLKDGTHVVHTMPDGLSDVIHSYDALVEIFGDGLD